MLDALGDALQKLSTADAAATKSAVTGPVPPVCEPPARTELSPPVSMTASATPDEAPVTAPPAMPASVAVAEVPEPVPVIAPAIASAVVTEPAPAAAAPTPAPVTVPAVAPLIAAPVMAAPVIAQSKAVEAFNALISSPPATSETLDNPPVLQTALSNDTAPFAEKSSEITRPSGSSSQVTRVQLLIAGVKEHRHMVAALVIAVCGMALWKDTHSNTSPLVTSAEDSSINMDSLLDDFEAVERPSLPDPAEPMNADADSDAPLLIPSSLTSSPSEGREGASAPVTAAYPDQDAPTFPSNQASESQPVQKSRPLRFTGRIQPAR